MFEIEPMFRALENDIFNQSKSNTPLNIITEEDGSATVELAVTGRSEKDLKVKAVVEDGTTTLIIESIDPELTEDEQKELKEKEAKRTYTTGPKIKRFKGFVKLIIPVQYDLKKAVKTVENGLLTIKIPLTEEAKPQEYEI